MPAQNQLDQIKWPNPPTLKDGAKWQLAQVVVVCLCSLGEVTQWLDNGEAHLPYHYNIDGVYVEYLPHWGYYSVNGINLPVPKTLNEIKVAVQAVKTLLSLGLKAVEQ